MDLGKRAKDSALAAFVALILAIPLVGFNTDQPGGTSIGTRWDWVAIAVVVVFVGRFAIGLLPRRHQGERPPVVSLFLTKHQHILGWIGLGIAIVWPFLPFASQYLLDLATAVVIYIMLGWGLNVVVGLAGLLNLGYAAFLCRRRLYAGAHRRLLGLWFLGSAAACRADRRQPLASCWRCRCCRLRGDYLAIVTLGFGEIIRIILINWQSFTYGPNGVNGLPRPTFFGLPLTARAPGGGKTFAQFLGIDFSPAQRYIFLYFVTLALALVVNFFIMKLRRLPVGRAWEALREDEIASRALGINPVSVKLSAFAVGALLAGFAGVFFATRQGFVSPESFNFQESATVLAIVVLGGMGSQLGIALAAIILVTLPEFGRDFAQYRMLLFGAAMVGIMIWRPRGLFSLRTPSIHLGNAPLSKARR